MNDSLVSGTDAISGPGGPMVSLNKNGTDGVELEDDDDSDDDSDEDYDPEASDSEAAASGSDSDGGSGGSDSSDSSEREEDSDYASEDGLEVEEDIKGLPSKRVKSNSSAAVKVKAESDLAIEEVSANGNPVVASTMASSTEQPSLRLDFSAPVFIKAELPPSPSLKRASPEISTIAEAKE